MIFNRTLLKKHRDRAAANFDKHDFLNRHVLIDLCERIADYKSAYRVALNLGCYQDGLNCNIEYLIQSDLSFKTLQKAHGIRVQADEEHMPFADNSFDLVVSNLILHWVNDLPGTLLRISQILKPEGAFFASIIGGASLIELRKILIEAEGALEGAVSSHLSPMIDAADASSLLQRAGFSKPVTDSTVITVTYPDLRSMLLDLRGMAQNNCLGQIPTLRRDVLALAEELYREKYSEDGRLVASFEVVMMFGVR